MVIGVISASIPVNVGVTALHQAKFRPIRESTAAPGSISAATGTEAASTVALGKPDHSGAGELINTKV
jgi:hypothetical protein